jgi:hypothetical protein
VTLLTNAGPLQQRWSEEHQARGVRGWSLVRLQIHAFAPDVLILDEAARVAPEAVDDLRRQSPEIRIASFSGTWSHNINTLRKSNIVFTCTDQLVEHFRSAGCRVWKLRHGFNSAVLKDLPAREPVIPRVFFAGGVARGPGYHLERERLLVGIARRVPLELYCPQYGIGPFYDLFETIAKQASYGFVRALGHCGVSHARLRQMPLIGRAANLRGWPQRQYNAKLRPWMRPPVFGLTMLGEMRRSAVALNSHIDMAGDEAANIRLFEATGVGACLLTDAKRNLSDMFEPGREVVTYRGVDELVENAAWLLDHPAAAEEIAAAGQVRTLRCHTLEVRAAEILAALA